MKKNLISVIILALVFANFVLTALLVFTILPETKKANEMITDVCSAIDLELNSGDASGTSNVPIDSIETYSVNSGEAMTINLKSEDGKSHYAVITVTLSLNKDSDNYAKYPPETLTTYDSIISDDIITIVSGHTATELNNDLNGVKDQILTKLQDTYGSDYVVGVNFASKQVE